MKRIFDRNKKFVIEVFKESDSIDHLTKLSEETKELIAAIFHEHSKDEIGLELADNLLCIFGAAAKEGFTYDDIIKYLDVKLTVNQCREWIKQPDGTYKHKPK